MIRGSLLVESRASGVGDDCVVVADPMVEDHDFSWRSWYLEKTAVSYTSCDSCVCSAVCRQQRTVGEMQA